MFNQPRCQTRRRGRSVARVKSRLPHILKVVLGMVDQRAAACLCARRAIVPAKVDGIAVAVIHRIEGRRAGLASKNSQVASSRRSDSCVRKPRVGKRCDFTTPVSPRNVPAPGNTSLVRPDVPPRLCRLKCRSYLKDGRLCKPRCHNLHPDRQTLPFEAAGDGCSGQACQIDGPGERRPTQMIQAMKTALTFFRQEEASSSFLFLVSKPAHCL